MARRIEDLELDPAVVVIPDKYEITMDEWLASLRGDEPTRLTVPAADLVAEARAEAE
jgi:hypothetical protein